MPFTKSKTESRTISPTCVKPDVARRTISLSQGEGSQLQRTRDRLSRNITHACYTTHDHLRFFALYTTLDRELKSNIVRKCYRAWRGANMRQSEACGLITADASGCVFQMTLLRVGTTTPSSRRVPGGECWKALCPRAESRVRAITSEGALPPEVLGENCWCSRT